jgi:hypothetical protein
MINMWDFNLLFLNIISVGSRTARRRNNTLLHERHKYQNLDEQILVIFREKSNSKCRDVMQYFVRTLPMKYKIYNINGMEFLTKYLNVIETFTRFYSANSSEKIYCAVSSCR